MTDGTAVDDVHAPDPRADFDHPASPDRLLTTNVDADAIIDVIDDAAHLHGRSDLLEYDQLKSIANHDWPRDRLLPTNRPKVTRW